MKHHINYYFLAVVVILVVFGTLFLSVLSSIDSLKLTGNTNYYLFRHLARIGVGLVLCFIFFKIPLEFLKKSALIILIINLLILVLVFFVGETFKGASRWINIGGITFQPAEFLKLTSVLYLSALLANKFSDNHKKSFIFSVKKFYYNITHVFLPFLLLLAVVSIILILQPDISTLGIIAITLLAIYFTSGTPLWHTATTILAGAGGAGLLIYFKQYRFDRFLVFFRPDIYPLGIGWQMKQSLIAIGSGGIFGRGLGMSAQKYGFLPEAMSDSVFAILGEETGIIGSSIIILLFILFLWFGIQISKKATDRFSKFTALGITFLITFQVFLNITSTIGLFPVSGLPLPFFSYGGSHLIAELIGVGILLNISKNK